MIPWVLLDTAIVPGDGGEMRLYQHDRDFSIRVGNYELMNNRLHSSEDELALIVCKRMNKPDARVLIGGLGMGFTLAAVLQELGPKGKVVQAELVPAVVRWNRGPLAHIAGNPLADRRAIVKEYDVAKVIRDSPDTFDAILLDVDNGPVGLTAEKNNWLYGLPGLKASYDSLRPGGLLAIWSSGPDDAFTKRLRKTGFESEQVKIRGRGSAGGPRYLIWVAKRP